MGEGRTEKGMGRLQKTYCFVIFFVSAWPFHTGGRLLIKKIKKAGGREEKASCSLPLFSSNLIQWI